jgi:nitrogen regulatory protein P-II 1
MGSRYIVAIVRSEVLTTLEQRLQHAGVRGLSVTKVKGIGEYANFFARDQFSEHAKIEIFTDESKVEAIVKVIIDAAHTGDLGDGIVTVLPVEKFYRIRTRSEGFPDAA